MLNQLLGTKEPNTSDLPNQDGADDSARDILNAFNRSQAIIEFTPDGIILGANQNFLDCVGYTLEEIKGVHHRQFMFPEDADQPEYQRFWNQLAAGEFLSGEFVRKRKDGERIWISASYNPIFDDQQRVVKVVKIASDITHTKREAAEANRLSRMVENMPINVIYADRSHVIRYMNPASLSTLRKLQHLLPIPVDSIVGSSIDTFHKNPAHQRGILEDPSNLPVHKQISLGEEKLDLLVTAIYDVDQQYVGAMATWSVVTEQAMLRDDAGQLGEVGRSVASGVTELAAAIEEVSQNVSRTASLAGGAEQQAGESRESIEQLSAASKEIEEVVSVISDLADQTNLLALNATIEAARAGESGRSFAVVAKEVKELAAETTQATENIGDRVERIRANITTVVDATSSIAESVTEVSQNSNTVAAAVEEQSVTVRGMQETAEQLMTLSEKLQNI